MDFLPKTFSCLRSGYSLAQLRKDLIAGFTVGVVALPLAMAFAIASGTTPDRGLYTAIVAGFLISLLGGSRVQIGGPTGAFVVIVYGIVQRSGYEGLCIATLIAGGLLILMGALRLGSLIRYIPHPLITGFTTGIALLIFSTQIKDFFGLQMAGPPAHFGEKWLAYFQALPTFDPLTLSIAASTLAAILAIRRFWPRLPWGIIAIVLVTIICQLFDLPAATIESRFGQIPRTLPTPMLPTFSIDARILMDALAIAFLGGIESLLSAVIGDGMSGGRHRPNCELMAQGIANVGSVLFGGIPATGAIARTALNAKSGAQTPVAGMVHAAVLAAILLCLSPIVGKIPLAALAAVLIMVSWNMSEIEHFRKILQGKSEDRFVLLAAFLLTVFVDITAAIFGGMILASLLFMKRMSQAAHAVQVDRTTEQQVFDLQGPFFFGSAHLLKDLIAEPAPKTFVLRLHGVPMIDATGLHALHEFQKECRKKGVHLELTGAGEEMKERLRKAGL